MVEAIVLSGGLGLRLRPLTNDRPKSMIFVCGKPLAEYQIEWLRRNGVADVTFACGYRHEKIRNYFGDGSGYGVAIRYLVEREPLGTGGAMKQALRFTRLNPIVVVNGDILSNLDLNELIRWHEARSFLATIVGVQLTCPYGVLEEEDDRICGFREKPVFPNVWVNAGIYVMERDVADHIPDRGDVEKEGFPELARKGMLGLYKSNAWWRTVDTVKELQTLERELRFGGGLQ